MAALRLEWDIGLRYLMVGKGDRYVSLTSLASAVGITLGVAAVIVVMSVMNGFHVNLRERILAASSHVEVIIPEGRAESWREDLERLGADERVVAAAPNIDRQGLLSGNGQVRGVQVKGVDPGLEGDISGFESAGDLSALEPGSFRAMVGSRIASRLGAASGDEVLLLVPSGTATLGGFMPRLKRIEVAGTVSFGLYQYDESLVYMHHEDVARLFGGGPVDTIRLRLADVFDAPDVAADVRKRDGLDAYDWTASNATLFDALAVERRVMFVILSLIILVAAFQIVAALVAMVRSKRGSIAVLRTIGLPPASILRIFLIQGTMVGVVGTVLGVALGLAVASNVNPVVGFFESVFGFDFFPGEVYFLETIPSLILPGNVAAVAGLAFALSLAATVWPSVSAARVDPAEALRHE